MLFPLEFLVEFLSFADEIPILSKDGDHVGYSPVKRPKSP